jgi:hypothetical protein
LTKLAPTTPLAPMVYLADYDLEFEDYDGIELYANYAGVTKADIAGDSPLQFTNDEEHVLHINTYKYAVTISDVNMKSIAIIQLE